MSYIASGFTPEQEETVLTSLTRIEKRQQEDEKRRKYTLIFGGIGLFLAAVKLGFVVIPTVRGGKVGRL
jgi:hypothetical protein